jgi:hypothetical protein
MAGRSYYVVVVFAVATACENSNLRAERSAYQLLEQQRTAYAGRMKECQATHEVERFSVAHSAAAARYVRADIAKWAATKPSNDVIVEAVVAETERKKAFDAWTAVLERARLCAYDSEHELDIRRAEYVAACRKCGVEERCTTNANAGAYGSGKVVRFGCESSPR